MMIAITAVSALSSVSVLDTVLIQHQDLSLSVNFISVIVHDPKDREAVQALIVWVFSRNLYDL